jgi:hypothetical protein
VNVVSAVLNVVSVPANAEGAFSANVPSVSATNPRVTVFRRRAAEPANISLCIEYPLRVSAHDAALRQEQFEGDSGEPASAVIQKIYKKGVELVNRVGLAQYMRQSGIMVIPQRCSG